MPVDDQRQDDNLTPATPTHGPRPRIAIIGGGAAGTLTALHLARTAARRSTGCDIVLLDPVDQLARGTAFGTTDDAHLLNVPASGMSVLPEDPAHFVAWRGRQDPDRPSEPWDFAPRRQWSRYLHETLTEALTGSGDHVTLRHVQARAHAVRRTPSGLAVRTGNGRDLLVDAVVVATGLPAAGHAWAPPELHESAFFVPDPWAPGALDVVRRDRRGPGPVLVVGSGLTMVDVVLSLIGPALAERNDHENESGPPRADRVLHAVSRSGRLPRTHARGPKLAAIPDVSQWDAELPKLHEHVARHLRDVVRAGGDWRPAMDGLRFQVAGLWARMSEADRARFVAEDSGRWNVLRHRMPLSSAAALHSLRAAGRLHLRQATVADVEPRSTGGLRIGLTDGSRHDVGWVVNCTGPQSDIRLLGHPLLDDLLAPGPAGNAALACVSTGGMGLQTINGRLVDADGSDRAPVWTLGALRRGELWESTAVPEIRTQALAVATAVLDTVAPLPRRLADGRIVSGHHPIARPRDPLGLPLSTTAEAASTFNAGLERVMRLQDGAEDLLRQATELDPDFALAHAALAMLGHEAGARADVTTCLAAARQAVRRRGDDRERSLVEVIGRRITDARRAGASALKEHIASYPRDVLAVSAAVPTIAFSGFTDLQQETWDLVENLAPAYGDHWWYISLLAFTRQEQSRYEDAGLLAESALACEPASGHAAHAQTHVMYETGQHAEGRAWLDHWIAGTGRSAGFRAHFAWHAALHELALGDLTSVRQRFDAHLAPPALTGVRALVDSASLLWRWQLAGPDAGPNADTARPPQVAPVLAAIDPGLLYAPQTPFIALHAAIALAAATDPVGLATLRRHCASSRDPAMATSAVAVCDALSAMCERRWEDAWHRLDVLLPDIVQLAGSAAQREVFQDALLYCLVQDGRLDRARGLREARTHLPSH